jgi:DNA ligase (NAD+)
MARSGLGDADHLPRVRPASHQGPRGFIIALNPECPSRKIEGMIHFASRNAMDIDGVGESVVEEFFAEGFWKDIPDIYQLSESRLRDQNADGWSDKSINPSSMRSKRARSNRWSGSSLV